MFKNKIFKFVISIVIPVALSIILLLLSSVLILNTNISESVSLVFMISITAICSIIMSVLFVLSNNFRGIVCSIISFIIMLSFKMILSIAINKEIVLSGAGGISILFLFLFCLIGGIVGSNIKK